MLRPSHPRLLLRPLLRRPLPLTVTTLLLAVILLAAPGVTSTPTAAENDLGLNLGLRSEAALGEQFKLFADYESAYTDLEDGEERFLFSSTSAVTVNSTLIRVIGAIIGALLLAIPLYLAYATATAGGGGSSGQYSKRSTREKREGTLDEDGECPNSF